MNVYQIRLKVYVIKDIPLQNLRTQITTFLDAGMCQNEQLTTLHQDNKYKNYCYDLLYPQEQNGMYKAGKIYTLTIRTIDDTLAKYYAESCVNSYTEQLKGLTAEIRIIPKKHIDKLYTLTPVILKDERGYWKKYMTIEQFEERIKVNLIKKWNQFHNVKLDENFDLHTCLELSNKVPISSQYKNIKLLGDKLVLHIADNKTAQDLAYMSLGTGLLEMNSRGFGYVNFRWI